MHNARSMMADAKFFDGYSRWIDDKGRYETWNEAVERVMNMHREVYAEKMTPELAELIDFAETAYREKRVLGAQRALQFGGEQLLKHQMRLYNCTSTYADRPEFFNELFYVLLCGAGAGFSVQKHHVAKLPNIAERKKQAKVHAVKDSIEGWGDAAAVLLSSFFVGGGVFPEYEGRRVYFDTSEVRDKGAMISGGFKAPGPEPLRKALDKIEHLIQGLVLNGIDKLRPIHVYDIAMHLADAVLAGGVRRSATICLFSPDDQEMLTAKTGDWMSTNKQRGRSNNSAVIVRSTITWEVFKPIMENIKEFGEPGFVFVDSTEHTYNPCVEIGKYPQIRGISGWQGCNLAEINGSKCTSVEDLLTACKAAAIIGTLQAGYTNFKYISAISKEIFDREALLGVSITGWMNSPDVLFDADNLRRAGKYVLEVNKHVAKIIGINPAARATCTKPSGNASVLLETASGIHGEPAPRYLRYTQYNKMSEIAQKIKELNPWMVEESSWSANNSDYNIAFPVIAPEKSIFNKDLLGVKLLEKVKLVQNAWVESGTDVGLCVEKNLRHNVSNTVTVPHDGWDDVAKYLFDNREHFAGVSFMSSYGDKAFHQAPFTSVLTEQEMLDKYGVGALFASGLVVDGLRSFPNLWVGITKASAGIEFFHGEERDQCADWVRRFTKFASNYFEGDLNRTGDCLKDAYLLHKWYKIQQNYKQIDFVSELSVNKEIDIDTMGAIACAGGACEI